MIMFSIRISREIGLHRRPQNTVNCRPFARAIRTGRRRPLSGWKYRRGRIQWDSDLWAPAGHRNVSKPHGN